MKKQVIQDLARGFLLSALFFSCTSSVISGCYTRSSYSLNSTWGITSEDEVLKCSTIAGFVQILAVFRRWEGAENYYGSQTTVLRILSCAGGGGDTYAISLYMGHGNRTYYQNGMHYFIDDNVGSHTYDFLVYPYTSARRTRFSLIWSCYQGEQDENAQPIAGRYDLTGYGPYGMPLGWMHTTNFSPDGYADPDNTGYAYISWNGVAPYLTQYVEGVEEAGFYFLLYFYNNALYYQRSLSTALDLVTLRYWDVDFGNSPFYNGFTLPGHEETRMVVYGDGNLELP